MTVITNEEFARNPYNPQPGLQGPIQPTTQPNIPPPVEGVERQTPAGAAFSRENILGAEADRQRFEKNLVEKRANADLSKDFDIADYIPDRHAAYVETYLDNAIDPESAAEVTKRLDQQLDDELVLQTSGFEGVALRMFASISDPTSLPAIPLSMINKMGKLGKIVVGSGVVGGSVAAQEAFLNHSQDTRTIEEINTAIGAGFLMGGFLGPLIAKNTKLTTEATQELTSAIRGQKRTYTLAVGEKGPVKVSIDPDSFRAKFGTLDCP
jgi:hypothetical protein